jgi:hypothetical protein
MKIYYKIKFRLSAFYEFFRYDLPRFIQNLWMFRRELYEYRRYDWYGTLLMLRKSIIGLSEYIDKHGYEIEETRRKKIYYMRRVIYLMDLILKDDFTPLAEERLRYKLIHLPIDWIPETNLDGKKVYRMEWVGETDEIREANRLLYIESHKIEEETWIELFDILKGNHFQYTQIKDPDGKGKAYEDYCTGKGLHTWWD